MHVDISTLWSGVRQGVTTMAAAGTRAFPGRRRSVDDGGSERSRSIWSSAGPVPGPPRVAGHSHVAGLRRQRAGCGPDEGPARPSACRVPAGPGDTVPRVVRRRVGASGRLVSRERRWCGHRRTGRGRQARRHDVARRGGADPPTGPDPAGRARRHARPDGHRRAGDRRRPGDPPADVRHRRGQELHGDRSGSASPPSPTTPRARWSPPPPAGQVTEEAIRSAVAGADRRDRPGAERGQRDQDRRAAGVPAGTRRRERRAARAPGHRLPAGRAGASAGTAPTGRGRTSTST